VKNKGVSPVTYGAVKLISGKETPDEIALTNIEDLMSEQCLDYIFLLKKDDPTSAHNQPPSDTPSVHDFDFSIDAGATNVEKFSVISRPFTQLSDHFGVAIQFNITYENKAITHISEKKQKKRSSLKKLFFNK